MDDLAKAIDDHSQYDGADYDKFWDSMFDKYWDDYIEQDARPNYKDFMLWCEDRNLIPDDEVFSNDTN